MRKTKKLKRCKSQEHSWRFKDSFLVTQYRVNGQDGNTYIAYAHNIPDLTRANKIEAAMYSRDCADRFEPRVFRYCMVTEKGKPIHKPFWYYGRVYLIGEDAKNA
jgi:hypothetical protein